MGVLLNLLIAEKSGFQLTDGPEQQQLRELADSLSRDAVRNLQETNHGQKSDLVHSTEVQST
jgi:hypothetical protein